MLSKDIITYSKIRPELRAYMCYLFTQNIINYMPTITFDTVLNGLKQIKDEVGYFDSMYILDDNGIQVSDVLQMGDSIPNDSKDLSQKAYFYEALEERRCILTNPYPSRLDGNLVITAAYPVYNQDKELLYVVCIDIHLKEAIKISAPSPFFTAFTHFSIAMYFLFSLCLTLVALMLMVEGVIKFWSKDILMFNNFDIKDIFESTILLTLALAIFDLVKAIFEEEVLGKNAREKTHTVHKTMIRFLGSIVIALAIEALMLVFKFTISSPQQLIYAVYLIAGVAILLIALAIYVKFAYSAQNDRD